MIDSSEEAVVSAYLHKQSARHSCQIILVQNTKTGKIYQNDHKIYQMAITKIFEMKVK
jgi:hypothetical protein